MAATAVGLVESTPRVTTYVNPPHLRQRRAARQRRYRALVAEIGPLHIDGAPVLDILAKLRRQGWTYRAIAAAVDMDQSNLSRLRLGIKAGSHVKVDTLRRFEELWARCNPPEVNLDPEPLVEHIRRRHGSVRAAGVSAQMAVLRREYAAGKGLTRRQADRWARRFGALEWEIWPELMP